MTLVEFNKKINSMYYSMEIVGDKIVIKDNGAHKDGWYDYIVAEIYNDEEYAVDYNYCVPFTRELYMAVYDFISTPIEERDTQ